jgi:hypothetical protein
MGRLSILMRIENIFSIAVCSLFGHKWGKWMEHYSHPSRMVVYCDRCPKAMYNFEG